MQKYNDSMESLYSALKSILEKSSDNAFIESVELYDEATGESKKFDILTKSQIERIIKDKKIDQKKYDSKVKETQKEIDKLSKTSKILKYVSKKIILTAVLQHIDSDASEIAKIVEKITRAKEYGTKAAGYEVTVIRKDKSGKEIAPKKFRDAEKIHGKPFTATESRFAHEIISARDASKWDAENVQGEVERYASHLSNLKPENIDQIKTLAKDAITKMNEGVGRMSAAFEKQAKSKNGLANKKIEEKKDPKFEEAVRRHTKNLKSAAIFLGHGSTFNKMSVESVNNIIRAYQATSKHIPVDLEKRMVEGINFFKANKAQLGE